MIINHNLSAINALNSLNRTQSNMSDSLERLSTGLRINKAADDAAGLAISQRMHAQVAGLKQCARNMQDGISAIQTMDGAMAEIQTCLQRMKVLALQSANATNTAGDSADLSAEYTALLTQIDTIANGTKFNGLAFISSAPPAAVNLQVGLLAADTIAMPTAKCDAATLTVGGTAIATPAAASAVLAKLDTALDAISTNRGVFGAAQNRLEINIENVTETATNLTSAESRITDTDMAAEMADFSKYQVLQQAGVSMAGQANQSTAAILKLLG